MTYSAGRHCRDTALDEHPYDWSPDEKYFVDVLLDPKTALDIWYLQRGPLSPSPDRAGMESVVEPGEQDA